MSPLEALRRAVETFPRGKGPRLEISVADAAWLVELVDNLHAVLGDQQSQVADFEAQEVDFLERTDTLNGELEDLRAWKRAALENAPAADRGADQLREELLQVVADVWDAIEQEPAAPHQLAQAVRDFVEVLDQAAMAAELESREWRATLRDRFAVALASWRHPVLAAEVWADADALLAQRGGGQ